MIYVEKLETYEIYIFGIIESTKQLSMESSSKER